MPEPTSESTADSTAEPQIADALRFFMEVDQLKGVERRNWLADASRRENTAEHSWHLGIAAMVMAPFATEPFDLGRAVQMALVHDIVEIDAGDTFAYDTGEAAASKEAREQAAADRLFGLLPEETGRYFRALWDDYESGASPEARFVMAVDRMAPMFLNMAEGGSAWREHGVTAARVEARNRPHIEPAIPALWDLASSQLRQVVANGTLPAD